MSDIGKDAYYFSHDANARNDPKMMKLRQAHGAEGYGIYFMVIEMMREQKDHRLSTEDLQIYVYDLRCDLAVLSAVVNNYDLFDFDGCYFFSKRLQNSMDTFKSLRSKRQEAQKKSVTSRMLAKELQSNCKTLAVKESKGKESKGKEEKKKKGFIPPTLQNCKDYALEKGWETNVDVNEFHGKYDDNGWKNNKGLSMVDWKGTMRTWNTNAMKDKKTEREGATHSGFQC